MSIHLNREIRIAYSPYCDLKWRPEFMLPEKFYPVYAYENGVLKRHDGTTGEAFYFHFAGEGGRPCRLIHSNAVIVLESEFGVASERDIMDKVIDESEKTKSAAPADDPGF